MLKEIGNSRTTGRVLVVDDEADVCQIVSRVLEKAGFCCTIAEDADRAWDVLNNEPIDLVTLDVAMPGRSGLELLGDIQRSFPDTAVLLLTGRAEVNATISALHSGASAYLVKPIDFEELLFHARRAIEHRQLILERRQYTKKLETTVREQTQIIRQAHAETIQRLLYASMHHDEETGAHIKRVGTFSEILARGIGWSSADADTLAMAAPLHDVGKIGVPDSILRKPGHLTRDEFSIMKSHTEIGASILAGSDLPVMQMAEKIARSHHERWDGSGYPDGLVREEIPEAARIVSIVDVYDAITHDRIYRPAMAEEKALKLMKQGHDRHFDPRLLDAFFDLLPEVRKVRWQTPDSQPCHADAFQTAPTRLPNLVVHAH